MLRLFQGDLAVEIADSIPVGSLVQLFIGGLIQLFPFAFDDDLELAVAATDVEGVEARHRIRCYEKAEISFLASSTPSAPLPINVSLHVINQQG